MTVSRIVLDPGVRDVVDQIQQVTRTTSPSAAIALIVSRYGRHLMETWELSAARYPEPSVEQYLPSVAAPAEIPHPTAQSASAEFVFTESIDL